MKKILCLMLGGLVLATISSALAGEPPVGQVLAIQGAAEASDPSGVARTLELRSPVFMKDRITTKRNAKLQILFADDSIISIGENSDMVIDEYIYTPSKPSNSRGFFHFFSGVFRAVTGKIAESKPDRFRVRTAKATIGIRGCDIGFRLQQEVERIYVLALPPEHRLVIEPFAADGVTAGITEVLTAGSMVLLQSQGRVEQQPLGAADVRGLIEETTPTSLRQGQGGAAAPSTPSVWPGAEGVGETQREDSSLRQDTRQQAADYTPPLVGGTEADARDQSVLPDPALDIPEEPPPEPEPEPYRPSIEPEPGPSPTPPDTREIRGQGMDWTWGFWQTYAGDIAGLFIDGTRLAPDAVQSILAGTAIYNLSGVGSAGALIASASGQTYVEGPCSLNVQIGGQALPNWDGAFQLSDSAANALNFGAAGSIDPDGALSGAAYQYSLSLNGSAYGADSLTRNDVGGSLLGSGGGAQPITGVGGNFFFDHGAGGPSIQGVYGADLR